MFDDLLPFYNSELRFMREMAKEFADAHPKIASRLRLSRESIDDPHVGRMIEAFSLLNARIRYKLDDEFPELTDGLLNILYPHYLLPIPSMSIVQFDPQPGQTSQAQVPKSSVIHTENVAGNFCQYRTVSDVDVWPIRLALASISGLPMVAPPNPRAPNAVSALRLSLSCIESGQDFTELGVEKLRFFIHAENQIAQTVFELLASATVSIALADSPVDDNPIILDSSCLTFPGFSEDIITLPLPRSSHPGYAFLTEYFTFPEKFFFFDVSGLDAKTLMRAGSTMEIYLYFDRFEQSLESMVTKDQFALGCTPMVNLFEQRAEPIRFDKTETEYLIQPDARRGTSTEVYQIMDVSVSDRHGNEAMYDAFYALTHWKRGRADNPRYWYAQRRASPYEGGGDDVYITLVDLNAQGAIITDEVVSINLLCTNRNLPTKLPFGGGRPELSMPNGGAGVSIMRCLTPPTRPIRPKRGKGAIWQLISHLALNHLAVSDGEVGADALRELLTMYDRVDSAASRSVVDRLVSVASKSGVARAPSGNRIAFINGTDITMEFEDQRLSGSGSFLLGAVLESVLASMCSINTFTRTQLRIRGERTGWKQWPARTGTRRLI
jgi:type VI secretion system protein ImpG